MNISSIFKRQRPQAEMVKIDEFSPITEIAPQGASSDIKDSDEFVTIQYGTGMPIDVIYAFIGKDYEQDGYEDALANADAEYCVAKEKMLLNQLTQLFNRILLRYRDDIRRIEVRVANAKSLFALTTSSKLEAQKEICEEHIKEIYKMMEKMNAKSPEMMTMIDSYRRGFTKGCAAQTANFINSNPATV